MEYGNFFQEKFETWARVCWLLLISVWKQAGKELRRALSPPLWMPLFCQYYTSWFTDLWFSLELTVLKKKLYPLFQLPMSNRNKYQLEFRLHKRQIAKLIHYHFFLPFVWRCQFLTASSYIFNGTATLPRKCIKWISGLHFEKPDF